MATTARGGDLSNPRPQLGVAPGLILTTALALGACADGTSPSAAALEVVSGDAQSGMGGWELELPIAVVARDGSGGALPGVTVQFEPAPGAGRAWPASVMTDGDGLARTRWVLGSGPAGPQTLTASSGEGSVGLQATALAPEDGDVLVVHGALGPLRGAILLAPTNTLQSPMATIPSDTVILLPPQTGPGRALVVLGHDNAPELVEPSWTSGPDTVHVALEPVAEIEIAFTVADGTHATRVAQLESQVQRMEDAWRAAGLGVGVGAISFTDATASGPTDKYSPGFCTSSSHLDRIEVEVLTTIDLGVYWGYSCPTGEVHITGPNLDAPQGLYLLAHEVGHVFGLGHRPTGMMQPNATEATMTMGEAFLANFAAYSGLNSIFEGHPASMLRDCSGFYPGLCLEQGYDLPEE